MLTRIKLFLQSAFPRAAEAFAVVKERRLSSREGAAYVTSVFSRIYRDNVWQNPESRSGRCSTVEGTAIVRERLPGMLARIGARTMLDAPCGDFNWMRHVDLGVERYIGADVVPDLIAVNKEKYARPGREFRTIDITRDPIPPVDVIFCRDCLIHLSEAYVLSALENFRRSGSKYLITTTFDATRRNTDILTGDTRMINLRIAPFNFPEPRDRIVEEEHTGKYLGLWLLADLDVSRMGAGAGKAPAAG